MELVFEWDEVKDKANLQKHDVSFEEAKSVFNDPFQMIFSDSEHSQSEERFISIGLSVKNLILVVIHTERGDAIRIISCRNTTSKERQFYEKGF